jgi:hypothetical protein
MPSTGNLTKVAEDSGFAKEALMVLVSMGPGSDRSSN